jgi:hypothetical protein
LALAVAAFLAGDEFLLPATASAENSARAAIATNTILIRDIYALSP